MTPRMTTYLEHGRPVTVLARPRRNRLNQEGV